MSRKTKPRRSLLPRHSPWPDYRHVGEAPRVDKPLSLICGVCGVSGRYDVGTVTIDPTVAEPSGPDVSQAVGFTGYFRCRQCDAGGPWDLTPDTVMYVTGLMAGTMAGREDVPLITGVTATFDGRPIRYATEAEVHIKSLIDREPERAFLWVRLGNLYYYAGHITGAQEAYERAIELDPTDIEAHSMFGQLLANSDRSSEAVPHFHAVLKHARHAHHVKKDLRQELVRETVWRLLEAHAESEGKIDLLPKVEPDEIRPGQENEPAVLELREFELDSEEGFNEFCDMFLEQPRGAGRGLFRRRPKRKVEPRDDWSGTTIHREAFTPGRNDRCPCGSGKKYKKCCGQ